MSSSEVSKIIDINSLAGTLAAMEAWYAALGDAIPKMRALVGLSGALLPEGTAPSAFNQPSAVIAPGEVPPGSFHAMSIPKAAVLYLKMVKQKQKSSDIAIALRRGGIFTKSNDFNNQIHASLDRAAKAENAEILKLHDAYWALREWFPANVRASMSSGAPPKKSKRNKKRKPAAPPTETKPKHHDVPAPITAVAEKAPEAGNTESRILSAMVKNAAKEWTPAEITAALGLPRAQTAPFLMWKMVFRGMLLKTPSGAFRIVE